MNFEDVVTPDVADQAINLVSEAVSQGPDSDQFDIARKLLALAIGSQKEDLTPEATASIADGALFDKSMAYKVGEGLITEEEAAESMADRKDSAFVRNARVLIAAGAQKSCEAVGLWIGTYVGSPIIGQKVGQAVGRFLNKPIEEMATKGAKKVEAYARQAWKSTCRAIGRAFEGLAQKFFG